MIETVAACHPNDAGCRMQWHGSNAGPRGVPEAPIEKVVVLHCETCAKITSNTGGNLPLCERCAAMCCSRKECPLRHMIGGGNNQRGRHLPYTALEKCLNMKLTTS